MDNNGKESKIMMNEEELLLWSGEKRKKEKKIKRKILTTSQRPYDMANQVDEADDTSEAKKQKIEYWYCKYRMVVLAGIKL
ncbi:Dynein heavy chain domain-containing protein [Dirofilaria immitis]